MEFRGAILKAVVSLVVYFYEIIFLEPGAWAWHKLKDRGYPKPGKTH